MKLINIKFVLAVVSLLAVRISWGAERDIFSEALLSHGAHHTAFVRQIVTNKAVSLSFLKERSQSTNIMEAVLASYLSDCFTNAFEVARYEKELDEAAAFIAPFHAWRLGMVAEVSKRVATSVGKDAVPFLGAVALFGPKRSSGDISTGASLRRGIAILVLGEIHDQRTTDILSLCLDCRNFDQREDNPVAYALRNKGDMATNALTRVISVEKDPWKRLVAGNAMALLKDPRAGLLLASVLRDKGDDEYAFSDRVRLAARILRDHPYRDALQALQEVQGISDSYAAKLVRDAIASIEKMPHEGD